MRPLQWAAFQRLVEMLQRRDNQVLVVLGPFNEHMVAQENRPAFRKVRDGIAAWLADHRIPRVVPETLPSELYADASHPLTDGYRLLAERLYQDPAFRGWAQGATKHSCIQRDARLWPCPVGTLEKSPERDRQLARPVNSDSFPPSRQGL